MNYDTTDEHLKIQLIENGFKAYPSHSNKFHNNQGQIVWTDGKWFKDQHSSFVKESGDEWRRYDLK